MIVKNGVAVGLCALGVCLLDPGIAPGQDPSDPVVAALTARVSQFLEGVSLGTTQAAYQELLAGSILLQQAEAVEALVKKTEELDERYGQYREFELIDARRVGKDLVLLKHLYKCESFPVVFYFAFYRTPRSDIPAEKNNNWRVIIVRFDTKLELLGLTPEMK